MSKKSRNIKFNKTDLSLIFIAIIWGTGFIATKMAIDFDMSPGVIMSLRFSIATLVLYFVFIKKLKNFTKSELRYAITTGLFLFFAFLSQTVGLKYTTPSNNALLTSTTVIMVPFITWVINKKRPQSKAFMAAVMSFLGMAILTNIFTMSFKVNIGDLLTILGAFLYACHMSYLEISTKKVETEKLTFIQFATAAGLSIIYFLLFDFRSVALISSPMGLIPIFYLGVFSTCLAFFIQTKAQKTTHPSKTAIILSSEAVFASILSVILGYELFSVNLLLGGTLIMGAVLFVESKSKYRNI